MLFSAIGAGVSAAGSIFGGIAASKAIKKQMRMIEQQKAENQAWFDRRYNEDATQKADAQRLLQMTEDSIKKKNRAAAGAAAVMGGTDESVAMQKAANNAALADTMSNINANAEAQKSQIEQQYLNTKQSLNNQLAELQGKKGQAIADAAKGVGAAGASIMKLGQLGGGGSGS